MREMGDDRRRAGSEEAMTWSDEDERELRHVEAMIDALCRLDIDERGAGATAVMQTAYWRARVEAIRSKHPAGGRATALTKALLDRLDALDAMQRGHGGARKADSR